jgi:H+-transporting ATPase
MADASASGYRAYDEKEAKPVEQKTTPPKAEEEEGEDEDLDALIEELESQDGHDMDDEEEEMPGGGRSVPEDLLQTSTITGLTADEVITRRKKYGLNAMKEERVCLPLPCSH